MSAATAAVAYMATITPTATPPAVPENVAEKAHHLSGGAGFCNPWDSFIELTPSRAFKGIVGRKVLGQSHTPDTTPPTVPVVKPTFLPTRETKTLRATWLGHAAYYVEFPSGLRVLFDPVFSERCSPFSWLGPKRYTPTPCEIQDIPFIDAVVISHNHYDHMDHPTIMEILKRHPRVHFFVPLGNKQWFSSSDIRSEQVTELDWWESRELRLSPQDDAKSRTSADTASQEQPALADTILATIGALPCQHMSARGLFDRCKTLWSSWSVESGGKKVYFGGDTGYRSVPKLPEGADDYAPEHDFPHCPAFEQVGKLRGPFDLGLIPIGAYEPRYLFSSVHANPFDAVNIFKDVQCRRAMGIHWGTWVLTEEDVLEPPRLLKKALQWKNLPEQGVFDVCDIGESREFE